MEYYYLISHGKIILNLKSILQLVEYQVIQNHVLKVSQNPNLLNPTAENIGTECHDTDKKGNFIYPGGCQIVDNEGTKKCVIFCDLDDKAGNCTINNNQACLSQSDLPFDISTGVYYKPSTNKKSCSTDNDCEKDYPSCDTDDKDCGGKGCCVSLHHPYLEWDKKSGGQCIWGNMALRQYCEYPSQRGDSKHPPPKNIPPFCYEDGTGKCSKTCVIAGKPEKGNCSDQPKELGSCNMTKDYCTRYGQTWNSNTNFCEPGPESQAGEFFVGKTLFYLWSDKGCQCCKPVCEGGVTLPCCKKPCPGTKENFKINKDTVREIVKKFDSFPNTINKLADKKFMRSKKLISKNFAGDGINLYLVEWLNNMELSGFTFDADEVILKFPGIVKKKNGKKIYKFF